MTSLRYMADGSGHGPLRYTHGAVAHYRYPPVVRAVAFALILWLGLDLATTGVCCQDELRPGATANGWAADHHGSQAPTAPKQADTCFCCAHVVSPVAIAFLEPHLDAVSVPDVPPSDRPGIRLALYHPPQFRS